MKKKSIYLNDNKSLRTGNDIRILLKEFTNGILTEDQAMAIIFLSLSKARSKGFNDGWHAILEHMENRIKKWKK